MIHKETAVLNLPDDGRVLITCKDGAISSVRVVQDNEHMASLKALLELARLAGYTVTKNDGAEW